MKKKGFVLTFWQFFIWGIIGLGIVVAVYIVYSSQVDVRQNEAEILNNRIAYCLKESSIDNFDVFENCKINKKLIEESGMYYIKIEINDKKFDYGVANFEILCGLSEKKEDFPKCYESSFNMEDKGRIYSIKILTASNQLGSKA